MGYFCISKLEDGLKWFNKNCIVSNPFRHGYAVTYREKVRGWSITEKNSGRLKIIFEKVVLS